MPSSTVHKDSSFNNHETLPVAIIGGGLGGLALAIGLLKHGIRVHIYESAPVFSEIGAGVAFGVNSVTALRLIDPRLLAGYKKHATYNADRQRDETFVSLKWGMDERKEDGHKAGDFMFNIDDKWNPERMRELGVRTRSCIHRARLLEELVALLPEDITSFGKTFETVKELADGTLNIHFADGTTAQASAFIGCDGVKSKTRDVVCGPHVKGRYAGECAYRSLVPRADVEAALGYDLASNGNIYCGYGGYIITYPVEHGAFVNIGAIPHDTGDAWIWNQDEWTVPATADDVRQHFKGWYSPLIDLVARFHIPSKWALHDLQHDAPYYRGRMCLLGDSAHATTPHLGAGAGMAMEDAYILSNLVASVGGINKIEAAFKAYDAVRRPRTQQCIQRSFVAALAYDFLLPGVHDDLEALKEHLEDSYKWLWHEDLEAQLEKAKGILSLAE